MGNVDAQYELGMLYHEGSHFVKDDRKSSNWIKKAAGSNYALAQLELAGFYRDGIRCSFGLF